MGDLAAVLLIVGCSIVALLFAALYAYHTSQIDVTGASEENRRLVADNGADNGKVLAEVNRLGAIVMEGAKTFLFAEYSYMAVFIVLFSALLLVCLGFLHSWSSAICTVIAFVAGSVTSILAGWIGMMIATYSNTRTAISAIKGWNQAFTVAFKAGAVMGFSLVGLGLLVLFILITLFNVYYAKAFDDAETTRLMFESLAGYGLGGSSIALFGRVGGGIYTKAADVGADLCKIEHDMNEDSPQNPAVIADNVGDNVGDIAGMGADLFGSFAESSCAAMVIASQSPELFSSYPAMVFPLLITAAGILVCIVTSFVATHVFSVKGEQDVEPALKRQILVSTLLMTPTAYLLCLFFLPANFTIGAKAVSSLGTFACVMCGLWSGMIIGYITEFYTSHSYGPTKEVASACKNGSAANNIIYGLALGYKSVIIPVGCLAVTIVIAHNMAGMFGIAMAALGILSTMSIGLTIDAYGPICDNAGGLAEMAEMGEEIRDKTDALDAAGNTTAAIGKGFAIGSAALVALALFGAYVTTVGLSTVDVLMPLQFAGLLVGAMLPYWFSAMTMKSVGDAAMAMTEEVNRQFKANPDLKIEGSGAEPDYTACIRISTEASLREMIPPGALVMLTPIIVGFLFGVEALAGVLAGTLVSGVQMAISSSNSGGSWDNAKKYIEKGGLHESKADAKGSPAHKAAVVGDMVGDPLKDTSGPALNILIKLSAIISLVFAPAFPTVEAGGYLMQLFA